ncbi:MAG: hypothetical protein ACJ78T_14055 [Myxococcales bacterium]
MQRPRLAVFVVATCLVAGCTEYSDPCFTPPSVVEDLRVLALSVDPPSPLADLATGSIEPVRLRALYGGTSGTVDVSWALCVPESNPICPEEAIIARNHEWASDSSLEVRVPPDVVAAARAADSLRGAGGIRVLATLRVAGAVPEAASTPIVFVEPGQVRNRAPVLTGMRVAREGFPYESSSVRIEMFSESPHGLRPVLEPGSLEDYDTIDFSGRAVHLRERIRYSFYASPGLFIGRLEHGITGLAVYYGNGNDFEADEPDPGSPEPLSGLIPLTAMGNGVLWVVARDSRGATSWLTVPVKVKAEDPRCAKGAFPPFFDCLYSNAIFGCL